MKKQMKLLLAMGFVLISTLAQAVMMNGLYSVRLPAPSQSNEERTTLIRQGLQVVIMRLTQNAGTLTDPNVANALNNADQYVKEFSYRSTIINPASTELSLIVTYQAKPLDKLLQETGLPLWGRDRPRLLILLAQTQHQTSEVLSASATQNPLLAMIQQQAEINGLPIVLPNLDPSDLIMIKPGDIQQKNLGLLKEASKHYDSNALLLISLDQSTSPAIMSQWTLIANNVQYNWSVVAASAEQVIQKGLEQTSQYLVKQYAVVNQPLQQAESVIFHLTGLTGVGQYGEVERYLRELSGVSNVEMQEMGSTEVTFSVKLIGGMNHFTQQLSLNKHFLPIDNNQNDEPGLFYQYQ